jgi:hypothetical protein
MKTQTKKNGPSRGGSVNSRIPDLAAENRKLRKAVQSLTQERDFLRDAIRAWAKKSINKKEMQLLVKQYRSGVPLQDFIDELEKEVLEAP